MVTTATTAAPNAPANNPVPESRATHPALRNAELANRATVPRVTPARGVSSRDASASPNGARTNARGAKPLSRNATDDEILGLDPNRAPVDETAAAGEGTGTDGSDDNAMRSAEGDQSPSAEPENLRAAFDEHPELRTAWQDAQAYRETFATPEEAREAGVLLADVDRMDELFFSGRAQDHAELARAVANLDPAAFASLTQAMACHAASSSSRNRTSNEPTNATDPAVILRSPAKKNLSSISASAPEQNSGGILRSAQDDSPSMATAPTAKGPTQAQAEFFHAANAAAVQGVLDAIETQVARLLPESVSKSARNRVVGEIYRELDVTLRSNRQLAQQMRDAYRSGSLDAEHQRALVTLVTSRAKQVLPGVAKRVLGEWTSTLVSANQDRLARQRAAEGRIDIAGSGGSATGTRQSRGPREIDYARMSDSDILNL